MIVKWGTVIDRGITTLLFELSDLPRGVIRNSAHVRTALKSAAVMTLQYIVLVESQNVVPKLAVAQGCYLIEEF